MLALCFSRFKYTSIDIVDRLFIHPNRNPLHPNALYTFLIQPEYIIINLHFLPYFISYFSSSKDSKSNQHARLYIIKQTLLLLIEESSAQALPGPYLGLS